jgi:hypothetical protein
MARAIPDSVCRTLETYGHLFPDELEALAGRLEDARADALAALAGPSADQR